MVTVAQIEESTYSRVNIPKNAPSDEEHRVIVPNMAPPIFKDGGQTNFNESQEFNLKTDKYPRSTFISYMSPNEKEAYIGFLKQIRNVFAWTYLKSQVLIQQYQRNA